MSFPGASSNRPPLWCVVVVVGAASLGAPRIGRAQELDLRLQSRLRWDRDAEGSDWDATYYTSLRIADIVQNRLDFKLSGWGLWDIDADDAFDEALDQRRVRISEAYFDLRNLGRLSTLRLGRQWLYEVDNLHFDGATVWVDRERPLSFFVFGGRPVSYYASTRRAWLIGGGLVWRPTWRTQHQFDVYALQDDSEVLTASAWRWNQTWGRQLRTTTRLRFIEGDIRDFRAHLTRFIERWGLGLDLDLYVQPRERATGDEARARALAEFGRILGPRAPTVRLAANVSKYFGEAWLAQLGGSVRRRLGHEGNAEDTFNSVESNHAYLHLTRFNAFVRNLDLTAGVESFNNELDRLLTLTGQASYRPHPRWTFSIGASFSHFDFDPIDFSTRLNGQDDVDLLLEELRSYVYFAEVRWRPADHYEWRADLAWEDTDAFSGNGWTARLAFTYHFHRSLAKKETP